MPLRKKLRDFHDAVDPSVIHGPSSRSREPQVEKLGPQVVARILMAVGDSADFKKEPIVSGFVVGLRILNGAPTALLVLV